MMRRIFPKLLFSLAALLCVLWQPVESPASPRTALSWTAAQKSAAKEMITQLDMTSFPNSIGPRREPSKKTLAQYGFTKHSIFDDGWAYAKMADDSWEFGIFVLRDGSHKKQLCITDTAVGNGTYHSTITVDVIRLADGSWKSTRVVTGVPGCS